MFLKKFFVLLICLATVISSPLWALAPRHLFDETSFIQNQLQRLREFSGILNNGKPRTEIKNNLSALEQVLRETLPKEVAQLYPSEEGAVQDFTQTVVRLLKPKILFPLDLVPAIQRMQQGLPPSKDEAVKLWGVYLLKCQHLKQLWGEEAFSFVVAETIKQSKRRTTHLFHKLFLLEGWGCLFQAYLGEVSFDPQVQLAILNASIQLAKQPTAVKKIPSIVNQLNESFGKISQFSAVLGKQWVVAVSQLAINGDFHNALRAISQLNHHYGSIKKEQDEEVRKQWLIFVYALGVQAKYKIFSETVALLNQHLGLIQEEPDPAVRREWLMSARYIFLKGEPALKRAADFFQLKELPLQKIKLLQEIRRIVFKIAFPKRVSTKENPSIQSEERVKQLNELFGKKMKGLHEFSSRVAFQDESTVQVLSEVITILNRHFPFDSALFEIWFKSACDIAEKGVEEVEVLEKVIAILNSCFGEIRAQPQVKLRKQWLRLVSNTVIKGAEGVLILEEVIRLLEDYFGEIRDQQNAELREQWLIAVSNIIKEGTYGVVQLKKILENQTIKPNCFWKQRRVLLRQIYLAVVDEEKEKVLNVFSIFSSLFDEAFLKKFGRDRSLTKSPFYAICGKGIPPIFTQIVLSAARNEDLEEKIRGELSLGIEGYIKNLNPELFFSPSKEKEGLRVDEEVDPFLLDRKIKERFQKKINLIASFCCDPAL